MTVTEWRTGFRRVVNEPYDTSFANVRQSNRFRPS